MKQGVRSAAVFVAMVLPGILAGQAATPSGTQPPVLTSLAINDTATTVARSAVALELTHAVAGSRPTEYRISARADMANALWLPYVTPLQLRGWQSLLDRGVSASASACDGRRAGQRLQLFLQLRSALGGSVHIVNGQRVLLPQQVESNIVSDAICVVNDR
jgi:hypothetical protein